MMLVAAIVSTVLAAVQMAAPPTAASASREAPNTVAPVIVEGKRDTAEAQREMISDFVRGLSEPTRRGRLARWDSGVCPAVVGLPERHGRYIADRIAVEALTVGLSVEGPGCKANILILVTESGGPRRAPLPPAVRRLLW